MKAIASSIGFSIFFLLGTLQPAEATRTELPVLEKADSCISLEEDIPNLIAARIFGQWKSNGELTSKFGPWFDDTETEILVDHNDSVLDLFDNSFGCAYAHGTMTMLIKEKGGEMVFRFQSPFMLVSQNGNPLLIVEEGGYQGNGRIEHPHPTYVMIAASPDSSHDLFFLGKQVGGDFMVLDRAN